MKNIDRDLLIKSIEASNMAHVISLVDNDELPLSYVNQAFLDLTGYSRDEVVGRNCRFLQGDGTNEETIQQIRDAIKEERSIDTEILNYKKDGTPFWNRLRMSPVFSDDNELIAFLAIQSDVTHIREQERILAEQQKLEALGRVSMNISHEIKNTIQPIKLMSQVLDDWQTMEADKVEKCLEIIKSNIEITNSILQDVLRLSRKTGENIDAPILCSELARDIICFTENLLTSQIELSHSTSNITDELKVQIHKSELLQVVLNIVNNAIYAMSNKGRIHLEVTIRQINKSDALHNNIKQGSYFCMSFEDSGSGMDEKTIKFLFDPFYSTKPVGEGTGLGLSVSYNLVKKWGGTIQVSSELNKGSTFSILIPVH